MIGQIIGENLYRGAWFLRRHRIFRAFLFVAVLAVFAIGTYRVITLRSLPCIAGSCQKPELPPR